MRNASCVVRGGAIESPPEVVDENRGRLWTPEASAWTGRPVQHPSTRWPVDRHTARRPPPTVGGSNRRRPTIIKPARLIDGTGVRVARADAHAAARRPSPDRVCGRGAGSPRARACAGVGGSVPHRRQRRRSGAMRGLVPVDGSLRGAEGAAQARTAVGAAFRRDWKRQGRCLEALGPAQAGRLDARCNDRECINLQNRDLTTHAIKMTSDYKAQGQYP